MPEDSQVLKGIDYRSAFSFTHLFRGFRIAVHPSKLLLGLALLVLLYAGGRLLDSIWFAKYSALPEEIPAYQAADSKREFAVQREARREQIITSYAGQLRMLGDKSDLKTDDDRMKAARAGRYLGDVKDKIYAERDLNPQRGFATVSPGGSMTVADKAAGDKLEDLIDESYDDSSLYEGLSIRVRAESAKRAAEAGRDEERKAANLSADQRKAIDDRYSAAIKSADDTRKADLDKQKITTDSRQKEKPGELAADRKRYYEETSIGFPKAMRALFADASQRVKAAESIRGSGIFISVLEYEIDQLDNVVRGVLAFNFLGKDGVLTSIWNFLTVGPGWLLTQHPIYFTIFAIWFLLLWSVLGGAICRIAAVHAARDEKISIRDALRFSTGKLISFFSAPLIPLIVLVVIGGVVAAVALIGNIPWLGPIVIGAAFFLALLAGLLMALVLIGAIGGLNLMYPTIAVEGSDSFDAISRSFSYLYARPWRLGFYTLIALVYGALCYLFVRFFLYVMLSLTHYAVNIGMFSKAADRNELWPALWPGPANMFKLSHDVDWSVLNGGEAIAAFLISMWVYLAIAMLGAFAISYYFSANTIIYYLMRREVDATEMDDLHLEATDDDLPPEPLAHPLPEGQPVDAPGTVVSETPPPSMT